MTKAPKPSAPIAVTSPRKKTGPKTAAGREAVRLNAAKHGILSPSPVVPGESEEDWLSHLDGFITALEPEGYFEMVLVRQIALAFWQLARVDAYTVKVVTFQQEAAELRLLSSLSSREETVTLHISVLQDEVNAYEEAMSFLERWDSLEPSQPLSVHTGKAFHELLLALLGVTLDDADPAMRSQSPVTVAEAKATLERIVKATRIPRPLAPRLMYLHARTKANLIRADEYYLRMTWGRSRAEASLLDEKASAKVERYEAHIRRTWMRDLHELQSLQERRKGRAVPVARLEIDI